MRRGSASSGESGNAIFRRAPDRPGRAPGGESRSRRDAARKRRLRVPRRLRRMLVFAPLLRPSLRFVGRCRKETARDHSQRRPPSREARRLVGYWPEGVRRPVHVHVVADAGHRTDRAPVVRRTYSLHLMPTTSLRTRTPGQRALRPHMRPSILDLVEERRLGLVGMVIWSVVLLSAACGIGFGVWLSLQRWMLLPPGVVLSALSARILLAAPPRLLWRRTSAESARPAIPAR